MSRHLIVLGILLASGIWAQTEPTDEQARGLAIETVAKESGVASREFNTKRMEELEDDLFFLQTKIRGQIRKGSYFFRVDNGGYKVTRDEAVYRGASSESWYVAVSTLDGETFGLYGFKDADAAYARLVQRIPIEVSNAAKAEICAKFYMQAVYHMRSNILYDELWLRHQVEDHFVGYAGSREPIEQKEQHFRRWWRRFKSTKINSISPATRSIGNGRYRVSVKVLEMTVARSPQISEWTIEVADRGAATLVTKSPIFPAGGIGQSQ